MSTAVHSTALTSVKVSERTTCGDIRGSSPYFTTFVISGFTLISFTGWLIYVIENASLLFRKNILPLKKHVKNTFYKGKVAFLPV
jgi:hypothetical protein